MARKSRSWSQRTYSVAVIAAAATTVGLLAACGSSGSGSGSSGAAQGGDYTIGLVATLSGPYAYIGQEEVQAAKGYFNRINAAGGINGHQVQIITKDDALSEPTAIADIKQLVLGNKVDALDGMDLDFICTAAAQYVATAHVPVMCGLADVPTFNPIQPYVFTDVGVANNDFDLPMLKIAASTTKIKDPKVAIMSLDAPAPEAWGSSVATSAKGLGWSVVTAQYAPLTSADIAPYAQKIAAANPDIVLANLSDYSSFVPTLRQDGFSGPIVTTPNSGDYQTVTQLKDPAFYQVVVGPPAIPGASGNTTAMKDFISDLGSQGATGVNALNNSPLRQYYLGDVALGDAFKSCGYPCSGSKLASAIEHVTVNLPGLTYGFGFSASSHIGPTQYGAYAWDTSTKAVATSSQTFAAGKVG